MFMHIVIEIMYINAVLPEHVALIFSINIILLHAHYIAFVYMNYNFKHKLKKKNKQMQKTIHKT